MCDLKSLTGLAGSTIQHYANLGLLPGTVKTDANMAWYFSEIVDRIRLIRLLQQRHRLSLAEIGVLFRNNETDDDASVMATLHEVVFGQEDSQALSREAFIRDTGLSSDTVAQLVASLARKVLAMGMKLDDLIFYSELVGKMVAREMRLRRRVSRGLSVEKNTVMTLELARI